MALSLTCFCGQPADFHPIFRGERGAIIQEPMCADCYAVEFPERWATFELARRAPNAAELREPTSAAPLQPCGSADFALTRNPLPDVEPV